MSDKMFQGRQWRFYINDMIGFAEKVLAYTEGMEQDSFTNSGITNDATLRNLELIGESARRIPEEVREKYREIPWRMIIATRNRIIHAYLGIDDDIIWSIIRDDIPQLLVSLKELKKQVNHE